MNRLSPSLPLLAGLVVAIGWLGCAPASAALLNVVNPSFEAKQIPNVGEWRWPVSGHQYYDPDPLPGWKAALASYKPYYYGVHRPGTNLYPSGVPDGVNMAFSDASTIYQVLQDTLQPNTRYTLMVDIGRRTDTNGSNASWRIELRAGTGDTLLPDDIILGYDQVGVGGIPSGTWSTRTITYTSPLNVPSGQYLKIVLSVPVNTGQLQTANFDNVRLDATAVPEPPSMVLAGTCGGLASLAILLKRRKWKRRGDRDSKQSKSRQVRVDFCANPPPAVSSGDEFGDPLFRGR